ncbi:MULTISPECIES: FadR/GntR family transcriptional regulator [Rhizobium]|jgi:GntR family transcriptional regulator, transcriptional repressor for pyruvate dehydrogenase complex|uniref:GntR family transcriptional regulator protein n=3 Tax=Rhizobium TaxID=379 RepID=A0A0B4XI57_9HYPH|nr:MULTISPECIES: FadR/GntR family transcriptional regulator [Rhizobium]TDW19878.1 GntR family transcriptional repressor for pyruvate dehydrogenase complex [Rhizobium azibense]AJD46278.1 GntR family transcriptional regulator protein [Rhizobium gallicum bv. gallicum R602sp]ANP88979.1 GntR family transcriptional regulator [Rhizobium leguminosarum]API55687.1 GntR family transcriptional regulator [Rhizobium leguminosarum]ASR10322.1 FadR family transcriptional regulator [Rhizobium leguminosarum bv. 
MGLETGTVRRGLADIVFERMLRAIKSGAYKPDERLPTEHDLAAEFEVSRPVIREALKRLRDQSLIYSRRGAGSFVRSVGLRNPLGFGQLENVADLLNCYEFRLTMEPTAAAAAAIRHDADSLKAIRQALELLRDATNRQSHREDADFQFHLAIARAAQNNYFSTAMEALKDHIAVGMKFHGASIKREASGLSRVFAEHEAIATAIANRDEDEARRLMLEHLKGSRERLFQSSHQ